jgi:lipid A 3-O-deacylase
VNRSIHALAAAAALLTLPVAALGNETPATLAALTLENDFFAGYDHHYTNGVQAAFVVSPRTVVAIGQRIYTPTNTDSKIPDPTDRPYAGWLYGMADVRLPTAGTIDHLTVSLGVVGSSSLGRQAQNTVHRVLGEHRAEGWDSQIGSEITAMVGYERAWPRVVSGKLDSRSYDIALRAGGALGNVFTYADAGAVLRYGRNLPDDLPVTHISLGPPRDGYRGTPEFGWYAWAGLDARAVARNIFLDGNTFKDSPGVKRTPFGYDAQLGVALAWPTARVGFTMIQRSREFDGQRGNDRFGQLSLSFAY